MTGRERHAGGKASWGWAADGAATIYKEMPRWQSKECVRCGPRRYHSVSSLKPQPLARIRTSLQPLALTMGMADSPARALLCGVLRVRGGAPSLPRPTYLTFEE